MTNVIIDNFDGFSDVPGFCGPFEDEGNLYCILIHRIGSFVEGGVWQSTDNGVTWAQVGTRGMSSSFVRTIRVVQDVAGRTLWILVVDVGPLRIIPFDLATLTFGSASATGPTPDGFGSSSLANFTFALRSDGSFIVYVSHGYTPGMITFEAISEYLYDLAGSGGWDPTSRDIDLIDTTNAIQNCIVSASGSDFVHGFTWAHDVGGGTVEIRDYGVKSDFSASNEVLATSFGGRINNEPMVGQSLSWDDAGTWRLTIPYWQIDDLHVIECTDEDTPASITDTNLGTLSSGMGAPLTSVVLFGGVRYLFTPRENAGDPLKRDLIYFSNNGSGWTGPTALLTAETPFNLSAAAVLSGIGIVYDDSSGSDEIVGTLDRTKFLFFIPGAAGAGCRYRGYIR